MAQMEEHAIVLRVAASRESDLVVTLLTASQGLIVSFAKGARRSQRRFGGGLDIFDCGLFSLEQSKRPGGMLFLCDLTQRRHFHQLRNNFSKLSMASLVLELASIFTVEGDRDGAVLYPLVMNALDEIDRAENILCTLLHATRFMVEVLRFAGYDPIQERSSFDHSARAFLQTLTANIEDQSRELLSAATALISYVENILGRGLKTRSALLQSLSPLSEVSAL